MKGFELDEAVKQHSRRMFAYALALLGDYHEAEDAVQDAFVSAWLARKSFDGRNLSAWLMAITRSKCFDRLRRARPAALEDIPETVSTPGPDGARVDFIAALGTLGAEDRAIVLWRVIEGLDYAEIASRFNISESAARKRYERARTRLAGALRGPGCAD